MTNNTKTKKPLSLQAVIDSNFNDPLYHAVISEYATTKDELEVLEIYEIAHERADGDANVIYTNKAHALIQNASYETQHEAEQAMYDTGGCEGKSYDEIATLIAYWIVQQETYSDLQKEVQELIAVLEQYEEELSEYVAELEEESDEYYKWGNELSDTQDLISALNDK